MRVAAPALAAMLAALLGLASSGPCAAAELVVSAAASLTNAFREIGADFERTRPGDKVVFNFAASDVLLAQIARGAPADVFASADREAMDKALAQQLVLPATRFDFAHNRLVLIVPAGKPAPASLAQLAGASFARIALGNPATVPVGRYAKAALEQAGLDAALAPRFIATQNVRQSLDYVARGECDAGFVYSTDAALMPDKVRVAFDVPTPTPIVYPIAVVRASAAPALAGAFLGYLRGPAGQAILVRYGFNGP
jgi:molybdate transport system substrate-binding protein